VKWIASKWASLKGWLEKTYQSGHYYEVLKTASAEVAVLLFVFPLIDMLGKDNGMRRNWSLVLWSGGIGLVFLLVAGVFAKKEHESDEE
jgi:hypothetical protein